MFAADAPTLASTTVFFAPLPYNLLLVTAVWRSAARVRSEWNWPARLASLRWLLVMTVSDERRGWLALSALAGAAWWLF